MAARRPRFPYGNRRKYRDIGGDTLIQPIACGKSCPGTGQHGIIEAHLTPDGEWCAGAVTFAGHDPGKRYRDGQWVPGPTWDVQSLDPLTISPSVLCTQCQHHGFIRDGKWVTA